jgi:tetratricopeptide (TPR) repeat protein/CHAT domain-containing protein
MKRRRSCAFPLALVCAFAPVAPAYAQAPPADPAAAFAAGQDAFVRRDYAHALRLLAGALPALEKAGDPRAATALAEIAYADGTLGDFAASLTAAQHARTLLAAAGNRPGEASILVVVGSAQAGLRRFDDAFASYAQAVAIHRELHDRLSEAADLGYTGGLYSYLGRFAEALPPLQAALGIYRDLENDVGVALALGSIGVAEENLARYPEALAADEEALALNRTLKNRYAEAGDLANAGNVLNRLGRYADALRSHQASLDIHRDLKSPGGEASDLTNVGVDLVSLARYAEALVTLHRALDGHRALKNPQGEANDLSDIGAALEDQGRYADALHAHRQALALYRGLKNRLGEARELGNTGNVYERLGRYDEALAEHRAALAIDREIPSKLGEASELASLASIDLDRARYAAALAGYEAALAIDRAISYPLGQAVVLGNEGLVEEKLGRYPEALDLHRRALEINRTIHNQIGEAGDLGNTGIVLADQGAYDDALAAHGQALAIDRAIGNRLGEAGEVGNIGIVEFSLGRYADALATYKQALSLDGALGNLVGEANDLANIGNALRRLDRTAEALAEEQRALTLHRQIGDRAGAANALSSIGTFEFVLKHYADARKSAADALAAYRAIGGRLGEADELTSLALSDEQLGRYLEALDSAQRAAALATRLAAPDTLWRALGTEAVAQANLGHRDEALRTYDAALDRIEELRAGLDSTERGTYFGTTLFVYDEYIAYLLLLDSQFPGKGYERKALEVLERKSARVVLEQIGQSAAQHFHGVPASVVADEAAANATLERAQAALSTLLSSSGADAAAEAAATNDVAAAKARVAALDADVRSRYPAYAQLRRPQPLVVECRTAPCTTFANLQQSILEPGELLAIYDLHEGRSRLWLVDREQIRFVSLPGSEKLDAAVERVRSHVAGMLSLLGSESPNGIERKAATDLPRFAVDAHALYRMLFPGAAAAALARAKRLIVVPSGSLYRLPFETLVDRDPATSKPAHYLIEDAAVSYVPSASLLGVVRTSYAAKASGRAPLLALANPAFGAAAPADGTRGVPSLAGLQLAATRSAFAPGSSGALNFPALPGTQIEADAIRATLGAPDASVISGEGATRQRVLELNASGTLQTYQYVVFATHAVVPDETQAVSQPAIVLAHPERGDGLLTMADVFGLAFDADFVMLSACKTGVGAAGTGDGISGLTRAFLYAGTPALSVTLWEVDDLAAPQLTPEFFRAMHSGNMSPVEALREAKLGMLGSPQARFRHPYAWAPSVIFGDGARTN